MIGSPRGHAAAAARRRTGAGQRGDGDRAGPAGAAMSRHRDSNWVYYGSIVLALLLSLLPLPASMGAAQAVLARDRW